MPVIETVEIDQNFSEFKSEGAKMEDTYEAEGIIGRGHMQVHELLELSHAACCAGSHS